MGEVELRNLKSKYGMTERCPERVSHVTMPGTRAQILLAKQTQAGAAWPTASCPRGTWSTTRQDQQGKGNGKMNARVPRPNQRAQRRFNVRAWHPEVQAGQWAVGQNSGKVESRKPAPRPPGKQGSADQKSHKVGTKHRKLVRAMGQVCRGRHKTDPGSGLSMVCPPPCSKQPSWEGQMMAGRQLSITRTRVGPEAVSDCSTNLESLPGWVKNGRIHGRV